MIKKSHCTGADQPIESSSLSVNHNACFEVEREDEAADRTVRNELSIEHTPSASSTYRLESVKNMDKHSQAELLSFRRRTAMFVAVARGYLTAYFYWEEINKLFTIERQEVVWEIIDPILAALAMVSSIVIWWLTDPQKRE